MSEQDMLIGLFCHGNLEALRQTKNLNLKSIDKLVYVFITILKAGFSLVGEGLGDPHELYVPPHNSCVPLIKSKNYPSPIFVDHDKICLDIFSIFPWLRLIWQAQQV